MVKSTAISLGILGTIFLLLGCNGSENLEEPNSETDELDQEIDTTFYLFESLVVNGITTIESSDTSYGFVSENRVFNIGEEYVFDVRFRDDSIFIGQGNSTSAIWIRFRDSIEVGYTAKKLRKSNHWHYQNDGRIFITTCNHDSQEEIEVQYEANKNKNYIIVKQLQVPIERADKIRKMSLLNGADFKEAQSKDPDFDEDLWE